MIWRLQEAKARLSELVRLCSTKGPQVVSIRGKEEAVIISIKEYEKLKGPKPDFIEFMNQSPLKGVDLNIERDKSLPRKIDLFF